MRIAYLILAHENAAHIQRTISRLNTAAADFYIHIDQKADIENFADIRHPRLVFCERRIDCAWGDISLVDATLMLVRQALKKKEPYDYFVLLSGACYPIQSSDYIEDFLSRHSDTEFIEAFPFPDEKYGKPMSRLTSFWIRKDRPFLRYKWYVQRLLLRVMPPRNYRKALLGMKPMGGSQWWTLSHAAVKHVSEFVENNREFYNFCKNIDCPDEFVFQTVLCSSPYGKNISHSLTYTKWTEGKSGPDIINDGNVDELLCSPVMDSLKNNSPGRKREVLFARKFSNRSSEALDQIDAAIQQRSRRQTS